MTELLNMPGSGLVVLIILSLIVYWVIRMTQSRGKKKQSRRRRRLPRPRFRQLTRIPTQCFWQRSVRKEGCRARNSGGKYKRTLKKY